MAVVPTLKTEWRVAVVPTFQTECCPGPQNVVSPSDVVRPGPQMLRVLVSPTGLDKG